MDPITHCNLCGQPLPPGAPPGFCPLCAFGSALEAGNLVGRILDDYEILEEIGRGGMGTVYKACQIRLNRIVALKVPGGGQLASAEELRRFKDEAETVARFNHPAIVAIHEVGEHDGHPYFSMAFIEGCDLAERLKAKPFSPRDAAQLVMALARAVHYAHQHGVLHRDLKPSNVLIDSGGQPHLTDFGLARLFEGNAAGRHSGVIAGSPSYMAPEQLGEKSALTVAVDVYGLGAVLYELITNRPPFVGNSHMEILRQATEDQPKLPRHFAPRLDRDLETICLKCLEKEPASRYQSAEALAEELEHWLLDEPILARPAGAAEKFWRWCRRKPVLASLSATTLMLLLAIAIGSPIAAFHINHGRREAEHARALADASARKAKAETLKSRRNLYAADMFATWHAIETGNFRRAQGLLRAHFPRDGEEEDERDFVWRYWWSISKGQQLKTLGGHSNTVMAVAWSPDGKQIASGSQDSTARVWSAETGELLATLTGPAKGVLTLDFLPDSRRLATSSGDNWVNIWDLETTNLIWRANARAPRLAVSPKQTLMAIGTGGDAWGIRGEDVHLHDYSTGKFVRTLAKAGDRAAFSPDGLRLATANGRQAVILWEVATGREVQSLPRMIQVTALTFSPDGWLLAVGTRYGEIKLWDLRSFDAVSLRPQTDELVSALSFSPDGRNLAASLWSHAIELWDVAERRQVNKLLGHAGAVEAVAFSPDGTTLASGGPEGEVMLWDPKSSHKLPLIPDVFSNAYKYLAAGFPKFSPDGRLLACRDSKNNVQIWDVVSHHLEKILPKARFPLAFSADGRTLLTYAPGDKRLSRWDTSSNILLSETPLECPSRSWTSDAISTDGKILMLIQYGRGRIELMDARTGKFLCGIEGARGVRSSDVTPDGQILATAAEKGIVELWNLTTRQPIRRLLGHHGVVAVVVFSADGSLLVSGGWDGTARVWDTASGEPLATLEGHKSAVVACAFSRDGRTVATASDQAVKLWHVGTWREVGSFQLSHTAHYLGFSPDGRTLAGGTTNGVHLWRAPGLDEVGMEPPAKRMSKRSPKAPRSTNAQ